MIQFLKDLFRGYPVFGGAVRSGQWSTFRKKFLEGKVCAVCNGTKKLELHHLKPFNQFPELELSPDNVLPLCESGKNGIMCHLFVGHLGNYKKINPDAIKDSMIWNEKLKGR